MNMIDECKIVEASVFSKNAKVTVQRSGKLGFSAEVELISAKGNLPRCRVNASTSGKIAGYSFTAEKCCQSAEFLFFMGYLCIKRQKNLIHNLRKQTFGIY